MAHDWDPLFASIGEAVTPDWEAAARYVDDFSLAQLGELLEWCSLPPTVAAANKAGLSAARELLRHDLDGFWEAVEQGHARMVRFWLRDVFVYVVDDRDVTDLRDSMPRLRWSGVLVAAGFDDNR